MPHVPTTLWDSNSSITKRYVSPPGGLRRLAFEATDGIADALCVKVWYLFGSVVRPKPVKSVRASIAAKSSRVIGRITTMVCLRRNTRPGFFRSVRKLCRCRSSVIAMTGMRKRTLTGSLPATKAMTPFSNKFLQELFGFCVAAVEDGAGDHCADAPGAANPVGMPLADGFRATGEIAVQPVNFPSWPKAFPAASHRELRSAAKIAEVLPVKVWLIRPGLGLRRR